MYYNSICAVTIRISLEGLVIIKMSLLTIIIHKSISSQHPAHSTQHTAQSIKGKKNNIILITNSKTRNPKNIRYIKIYFANNGNF